MEKLYTISEISKKFKTTTRQLRFYEEKNLLKPAMVNQDTGYRYYSDESCKTLQKILCLKDIGFSLNDISNYFMGDITNKKAILLKYFNQTMQENDILNKILKNNDFDLDFTQYNTYTGNDISTNDIATLNGVWILKGIFHNIRDAKNNVNQLEYFTPYKFLAFDKEGNSPWFYTANDKKIVFNTFNLPTSENYKIINNKLYLKISNFSQHLFAKTENPITFKHILVYEKVSDTYDDYVKYTYKDTFNKKFILDGAIVGVWKTKNNSNYLIVEKNGSASLCTHNSIKLLSWTKNYFYDKENSVSLKYLIKNNILSLETKSRIYTFCGINNGYQDYYKCQF